MWSRADESEWDKERERWVKTLEEVEKTHIHETEIVYIDDREADHSETLLDTHYRGHEFIIRTKHDRFIQGEVFYLSWNMKK